MKKKVSKLLFVHLIGGGLFIFLIYFLGVWCDSYCNEHIYSLWDPLGIWTRREHGIVCIQSCDKIPHPLIYLWIDGLILLGIIWMMLWWKERKKSR